MVMAIAEDMKKLAENIITSHDVRVKSLGTLMTDTHKTLKGFERDRKKMAVEQANDLADFVTSLAADVGSMLSGFEKDRGKMSKELKGGLAKEVKEIETYVANKLKEFNKAHAGMSVELKKELNSYVMGIVKETQKLLKEYGSDMAQASKAWKGMAATMAKSRKAGFMMPEVDAGQKVTTVKQAAQKAQGKKKSPQKSKNSRKKVAVGV
jgi:hypothetical protein